MKKYIVVLMMFGLLLAAPAAYAESPVKVTVGVKSWFNWWEHSIEDNIDGTSQSWDNGSSFMVGPSLNLKVGGAFLSGTFLKSTSDYEAPDWDMIGDKMRFERQDTDVTLGYMFVPYVGAFVGYKKIEADMTYFDLTGTRNPLGDGKWEMSGPGIGILGNIPLGRSAALYGNLAFLKLEQEFSDIAGTDPSFDMVGGSFELGGAFAITEGLSANVGFKYQLLWGEDEVNQVDHEQDFYGVTLGMSYTF